VVEHAPEATDGTVPLEQFDRLIASFERQCQIDRKGLRSVDCDNCGSGPLTNGAAF
jgi:hypothetical protein